MDDTKASISLHQIRFNLNNIYLYNAKTFTFRITNVPRQP